ncbi:hypothetical protein ABT324_22175 [Saccharopolyspora sp. NPDC000359]|uniref:hypothetical protein n=1 Tax=Saccharopolyspora sp. NPDC000359 TaxID=3154251 RepID=UPI00332B4313
MSAVLVPWLVMAGGLALIRIEREGALSWVGLVVGLIAAGYSSFFWGKFSDSDGVARVRLSALAWVARIICHAFSLLFLLVALVFVLV